MSSHLNKDKIKRGAKKILDGVSTVGVSMALGRPVKVKDGVTTIIQPKPREKKPPKEFKSIHQRIMEKLDARKLSPQAKEYKRAMDKATKSGGSDGVGVGH